MKLATAASLGLAAVLATVVSGKALATTYEFKYTFVDDLQYAPPDTVIPVNTVSGFFTGTGPLSDITVDSVLSMSLGATALTGPITVSHFQSSPMGNSSGTFPSGGATVSNAGLNNFLFESSQTGAYFYVIQPWYNGDQTIATQYSDGAGKYIDYYNGQYVPGNFSVSAVPEPATWAMMLVGFAGLGLAGYSRTKRRDGVSFSAA